MSTADWIAAAVIAVAFLAIVAAVTWMGVEAMDALDDDE